VQEILFLARFPPSITLIFRSVLSSLYVYLSVHDSLSSLSPLLCHSVSLSLLYFFTLSFCLSNNLILCTLFSLLPLYFFLLCSISLSISLQLSLSLFLHSSNILPICYHYSPHEKRQLDFLTVRGCCPSADIN